MSIDWQEFLKNDVCFRVVQRAALPVGTFVFHACPWQAVQSAEMSLFLSTWAIHVLSSLSVTGDKHIVSGPFDLETATNLQKWQKVCVCVGGQAKAKIGADLLGVMWHLSPSRAVSAQAPWHIEKGSL